MEKLKFNAWELEKYKNKNSRFDCPKCGAKKSFAKFVISGTDIRFGDRDGENDPLVGSCNKKDSCGHYKHPTTFFKENKIFSPKIEVKKIEKEQKTNTIDPKIIHSFKKESEESNLFLYLSQKFEKEKVFVALDEYNIGHLDKHKGSTLMPIQNLNGEFVNGKIYHFDAEKGSVLKVEKEGQTLRQMFWLHKVLKIEGNFKSCFFGEHLIAKYPEKPIAIVESERTAVFMACAYPQYNWIASMGVGNLTGEKLAPILEKNQNKTIFLFPDKGQEENWSKKTEKLKGNFKIFDGFPKELKNGADIEDLLNADQNFKITKKNFYDHTIFKSHRSKNRLSMYKFPIFSISNLHLSARHNFVNVAKQNRKERQIFLCEKNLVDREQDRNIKTKNKIMKANIYSEPIWEKNQDEAKVYLPVYLEEEKKTAKVYLPKEDFEKVLKSEIGEGDLLILNDKQKKGEDFVLEALEEEKNFFRKKEITGVIHEKIFLDKNGKQCSEKEAAEVLLNVAVPKNNIEKEQEIEKVKPIDAFDLYGLRFGILEYKTNQKLNQLKEKDVIKIGGTVEKKADGSKEFNSISGGISFVPEEKKEAILNGYNTEKKEIEQGKQNAIVPEIKHTLTEKDFEKNPSTKQEKLKQKELIL